MTHLPMYNDTTTHLPDMLTVKNYAKVKLMNMNPLHC